VTDPYRTLGVDRGATPDEIKHAFRRLALRHHPDRNPGDREAESQFKEVTAAYELLSDPLKRMQYDRLGQVYTGSGKPGFSGDVPDIRELFDHLMQEAFGSNPFRGRKDGPRPGENLRTSLRLPLEEVATGTEREVSFERQVACKACGGTGRKVRRERTLCPDCGGSGESRKRSLLRGTGKCRTCRGEGYVRTEPCDDCGGNGRKASQAALTIKVPAGVNSGQRLKVRKKGNVGQRSGSVGDLFVVVDVEEHPYFQRDGRHIYCRFPVSFAQLALGSELEVPTLGGPAVIQVPPGTQPDQVMTMKSRGLPGSRGGRPGDQRVRLVLEVPTDLTASQRSAIAAAADATVPSPTRLRRQMLDALEKIVED